MKKAQIFSAATRLEKILLGLCYIILIGDHCIFPPFTNPPKNKSLVVENLIVVRRNKTKGSLGPLRLLLSAHSFFCVFCVSYLPMDHAIKIATVPTLRFYYARLELAFNNQGLWPIWSSLEPILGRSKTYRNILWVSLRSTSMTMVKAKRNQLVMNIQGLGTTTSLKGYFPISIRQTFRRRSS